MNESFACTKCGTVAEPTTEGCCIACGMQIGPPAAAADPTPPPFTGATPGETAAPPQRTTASPPATAPLAAAENAAPPASVPSTTPARPTQPVTGQPAVVVGAHCPMCGHRCGPDERFCAMCGHNRMAGAAAGAPPVAGARAVTPTTPPLGGSRGSSFAAAPPGTAQSTGSSFTMTAARPARTRRLAIIGGVVVAALVIGGVVLVASRGGQSGESATPVAPPTSLSLAERTSELATKLTSILCPTRTCIDSSTPGVITFDSKPLGEYDSSVLSGSELERAATETGVWSSADAKRMLETRALDGTLTSSSGAATWTYHPDSGLDIVIDVEQVPTGS